MRGDFGCGDFEERNKIELLIHARVFLIGKLNGREKQVLKMLKMYADKTGSR